MGLAFPHFYQITCLRPNLHNNDVVSSPFPKKTTMSSHDEPLSFVECPYEILINILKRVDSKDIIALGLVCYS